MSDIDDALARGFRYPGRPSDHDGYDLYDGYDHDDDCDEAAPRPPLPLAPTETASLARAIDAGLRGLGCDNTLRTAQAWARAQQVPWPGLREALEERGGFCDCEVLMNVLEPPD